MQDENTSTRILSQVLWAVMKHNFFIQRWHPELELEEVQLEFVPFWVQLHSILLNMSSENNVDRIAMEIGVFMEVENLMMARGFLRVRVVVNTPNPLITGC